MKRLFSILTLIMIMSIGVLAQSQKITVNASDLTSDQLAKIKAEKEVKSMSKKISQYGEWVGIGGEVGIAIKEGLTAVAEVADKFGSTRVGEFTMLMIGWKVMGKDIIKIFLGLLFISLFTYIMVKFYRDTFVPHKILKNDPGFFKYPKEYEIINPVDDDSDVHWLKLIFLVVYFIAIWITYTIMF